MKNTDVMIITVKNQIRNNKPLGVSATFDRLIEMGYSEAVAEKMIADILSDQIFNMLNKGKVYDENRYIKDLMKLPRNPEDEAAQKEIVKMINKLKKSLETSKPNVKLVSGKSYIFKVALNGKNLWRKIQINDTDSLDVLSEAILKAYDFDNDHLYGFFMDNKAYSRKDAYYSPQDGSGEKSAADKKLYRLGLVEKQKFLYVFDFGDDWRFTVTFEKAVDEKITRPIVIASKGEAPPQYPDFDDDGKDDWELEAAETEDGINEKPTLELLPGSNETSMVQEEDLLCSEINFKHLTPEEYIRICGYPVLGIDHLLLELLNVAGISVKDEYNLANAKIKKALLRTLPKAKTAIMECEKCKNKCWDNLFKTVDIEALYKRNEFEYELLPDELIDDELINLVYVEFANKIADCFYEQLVSVTSKAKAKDMMCTAYFVMIDYIADNCRLNCDDKCLVNRNSNAYCFFCTASMGKLSCPKENQSVYKLAGLKPGDLIACENEDEEY